MNLENIPGWVIELVKASLWGALVASFAAVNALFLVWLERKVSAKIQLRRGPLHTGPEGLLQTLADAVKLLSKEIRTPRQSGHFLYLLAPVLVFAPVVCSFIVLPLGPGAILKDLNIGFLLIFAFSSIIFIGIFTAGWASNNKFAALGALRAVAQNISYEIPLLLSVMGVVLLAGSLRMTEIVGAQSSTP
jgi:NADH-quinone oxidoreductase subunit H